MLYSYIINYIINNIKLGLRYVGLDVICCEKEEYGVVQNISVSPRSIRPLAAAWQLCRVEGLHSPGRTVTAAVLRTVIKETHCIIHLSKCAHVFAYFLQIDSCLIK
jgi:hypothetical protein